MMCISEQGPNSSAISALEIVSVIGANAVVLESVPDDAVVAGVPTRVIRIQSRETPKLPKNEKAHKENAPRKYLYLREETAL